MDSTYAPLGPIVSIVPSGRRLGPVALAVGVVAVLLIGFIALAATLVFGSGRHGRTQSSVAAAVDEPADGDVAAERQASAPALDSAPAAAPASEGASPPEPAAAIAAAPDDDDEVSEQRREPRRRAARRGRRAHGRRVARARRPRTSRAAAPRQTASRTSSEPARLVPSASRRGGFGSSADVMRSLGL